MMKGFQVRPAPERGPTKPSPDSSGARRKRRFAGRRSQEKRTGMKASGQRPEGYRIVGVGSDAGPHFVCACAACGERRAACGVRGNGGSGGCGHKIDAPVRDRQAWQLAAQPPSRGGFASADVASPHQASLAPDGASCAILSLKGRGGYVRSARPTSFPESSPKNLRAVTAVTPRSSAAAYPCSCDPEKFPNGTDPTFPAAPARAGREPFAPASHCADIGKNGGSDAIGRCRKSPGLRAPQVRQKGSLSWVSSSR